MSKASAVAYIAQLIQDYSDSGDYVVAESLVNAGYLQYVHVDVPAGYTATVGDVESVLTASRSMAESVDIMSDLPECVRIAYLMCYSLDELDRG